MFTPRLYDHLLEEHFAGDRQMAFVSGPRQVGKTTTCLRQADAYVNWDNLDHRERVLAGPKEVASMVGLHQLAAKPPLLLFDDLHKFDGWKQFLKGFLDTYDDRARIVVAGSTLDEDRRGRYRMHPFTVAEITAPDLPSPGIVRAPKPIAADDFDALWQHGGYPEPYLRRDLRFLRRWRREGTQVLRGCVGELTGVRQPDQLRQLADLGVLQTQHKLLDILTESARQLEFSELAEQLSVSTGTIRSWVTTISENLHLGFLVRSWFEDVSRKEPKWYLRDWAAVGDVGRRAETFIACHLLKAVEGWNDLGLGAFKLGYLRDKHKREVDFVVVRDDKPWFLVEAKHDDAALSPALAHFQQQLDAPFAFQASVAADYVDADCFASPGRPLAVPARTLLSQLL